MGIVIGFGLRWNMVWGWLRIFERNKVEGLEVEGVLEDETLFLFLFFVVENEGCGIFLKNY